MRKRMEYGRNQHMLKKAADFASQEINDRGCINEAVNISSQSYLSGLNDQYSEDMECFEEWLRIYLKDCSEPVLERAVNHFKMYMQKRGNEKNLPIKEAYCRKHCDHYGMCADSECVWESFRTSVNAYKSKVAWKSSKT